MRCSRYQGDIPKTSTPVRPAGFSRVTRAPLHRSQALVAGAPNGIACCARTVSAVANPVGTVGRRGGGGWGGGGAPAPGPAGVVLNPRPSPRPGHLLPVDLT